MYYFDTQSPHSFFLPIEEGGSVLPGVLTYEYGSRVEAVSVLVPMARWHKVEEVCCNLIAFSNFTDPRACLKTVSFSTVQEVSRAISTPQDRPQGGGFLAKLRLSSRLSQKLGKSNVALVPKPGTPQNGNELLANLVPRRSESLGKDLSPLQAETEPTSRPEETPSPSRAGCEPNLENIKLSFPTEKRDAASLGHGVADVTGFVGNKVQKLSRQSSSTDVSLKLDSMSPPIQIARVSVRARSSAETVCLRLYDKAGSHHCH